MSGRWGDPSAFRADPNAAPATRPSRRQTIALLVALALVAGAAVVGSYLIHPGKARAFDLFHGSVFVGDQNSPVAVDLATGKPTLRLSGAGQQVGITGGQTMAVVPLGGDTLLLNQATGEFNMVDNSGFVVKHDGGGVPLVKRASAATSIGLASRDGQAYIVRTGTTGGTDVYLVGQPTVESALYASSSVRPRASGSIRESVSTGPGGTVSANGNLWLLAGSPSRARTIRELSVPPGSSSGAALVPSDHGRVNGPAALGTATAGADGSGADVVGVASPNRIELLIPGSRPVRAAYAAPRGVHTILPTSNAQGRLAFLMQGSAGWYLVSINADGTGLRAPEPLSAVPSDASLAQPAVSDGRLYTIDKSNGRLYQIDYDGTVQPVQGRPKYPFVQHVEAPDFSDAYVMARGPRVIYDSPMHNDALMVFTDGSHSPRVVVKSAAVRVDAAGSAEALTHGLPPQVSPGSAPGKGKGNPKAKAKSKPRPQPQQVAPINNSLNCRTVRQKPHIPVIMSAVPGSRTVALTWSYPLLSPEDCYPSTYLVSVKKLSADAPQPPGSVEVQSQTGATITGLFPSTRYAATVTAYIHGIGTVSLAREFVTGPEGPAAPTNVRVSADNSGNWHLSWSSCGTVAQGCVSAQSWTITPSFCDGRGVSSPPQPITVTGDPTSKRQPPATYPGRDELLGRGLRFQVQGTGDQGQAGAPSATSGCFYSWTPPVAGDLSVLASSPPATAGGLATTSTVATVKFADGQVHDLGGVGGTLTYELRSGNTVVDRVGPTTASSVKLHGIRAAQNYNVRVLASAPRHPNVVVPVGPVSVVPAIAHWPTPLVNKPTFQAPPGLSGTLHVSFAFPAGTNTRGETFDLVNSRMICGGGNSAMNLVASDVAPGHDMTFPVNRIVFRGPCTVTIQLAQDASTATKPALYGAGSMSQRVTSGSFIVDPPSITSTAGDFQAQWSGPFGNPSVVVSYHGNDDLADGATNWRMFVTNDGGTTHCGSATGNPPPVSFDVSKSCVKAGGNFQVDIQYTYFLVHRAHFDVAISGQAPQPVDPTKISFTAAWNNHRRHPAVNVTYTGSESRDLLATLNWTEQVTSSVTPGVVCNTGGNAQHDNPGTSRVQVDVDLTACPPMSADGTTAAVYTVDISFTDPNYGQTGDYPVTVPGSPPT